MDIISGVPTVSAAVHLSARAHALSLDCIVEEIISWLTPFAAINVACLSHRFHALAIRHVWRCIRFTRGAPALFWITPPGSVTRNVDITADLSNPNDADWVQKLVARLSLVREFMIDASYSTPSIEMIWNMTEKTTALEARTRVIDSMMWALPALAKFRYPAPLFHWLKRLKIRIDHVSQLPLLSVLFNPSIEDLAFDFVRHRLEHEGNSTLNTAMVAPIVKAYLQHARSLQRLIITSEVFLSIRNPAYSFIQAIEPEKSTLHHYAGTKVFFTDGVVAALADMPWLESLEMLDTIWDAQYPVPMLNRATLRRIAAGRTFPTLQSASLTGSAEVVESMLLCFSRPLKRAHIHLSEVRAPEELERVMRRLSVLGRTLTSVYLVDATNDGQSERTPSFDYKDNILRFLLHCTLMRTFEFDIEGVRLLNLRDVYLDEVSRAWPLLEEFTMMWGGRDFDYVDPHHVRIPQHVTTQCLVAFSRHCPHLRRLQFVGLNSAYGVPFPLPITTRHTARKLTLRVCFEPLVDARKFAVFLHSLWPDLAIDFYRVPYISESHGNIEGVDRYVRAFYDLRGLDPPSD